MESVPFGSSVTLVLLFRILSEFLEFEESKDLVINVTINGLYEF